MPFNENIPQPTNRIKASQNDLLMNFDSLGTWVGIDHITFDAASGNQGKHNTVSIPDVEGGTPSAVADEVRFYSLNTGSEVDLFLLPDTAAPNNLKAARNISGGTREIDGDIRLPCGIRLMWGTGTTSASAPTLGMLTVTYINGMFAQIFTVTAAISQTGGFDDSSGDGTIRVYQRNASNFKVVSMSLGSSGTRKSLPFNWFAIGI